MILWGKLHNWKYFFGVSSWGFPLNHWLLNYKQHQLKEKFDTCDVLIGSVDEEHPYSPLQPPRGYGGVAVMWKNSLSRITNPVLKTSSIAAVEITIDGNRVLVVSVYMPCRGYNTSEVQFSRVLDQLHQLLEDYISFPVIIGGDWNASTVRNPPKPRDDKFKQFIRDCNLHLLPIPPGVPTFLHHNKKDSAQIDYMLTRDIPRSSISTPRVLSMPLGTSDHHAVTATVSLHTKSQEATVSSSPVEKRPAPYSKIRWDKVDLTKYREGIDIPPLQDTYTETLSALASLTVSLRKSSEAASTAETSNFRKSRITSPSIKAAALAKRDAHRKWKEAGKPRGQSAERNHMTIQKALLRKALKQEFRRREDARVQKLNEARQDNRTLMFRLIKSRKSSAETDVLHYDGEVHTTQPAIREAWKSHYASQVTPKPRSDEYHSTIEIDFDFLTHLALQSSLPPVQADLRDIISAVQSLNMKKAPDSMGIQAEHLRYGGPEVLTFVMIAVNKMFKWCIIPRFLKEGVLSSVFKNKPPIVEPTNHRGITVTVVLAKVVERLMLRASYTLTQSPYQRGFTEEVSPLQASWLVQQAISDANHRAKPVYVAYLDAKAAFDAVYIKSLLRRLFLAGIQGPLWLMYHAVHSDATSRIKWGGALSDPFPIQQGVRQGGLISTCEYKQFVDPLLRLLDHGRTGHHVGHVQIAAPTCADDVALVANTPQDMQVMLDLAHNYSKREGYSLQPKKCVIVTYGPQKLQCPPPTWTLGPDPIPHEQCAVHIGVERDSATGGVESHLTRTASKANKAFFAKMRPKMSPVVALDIYMTTVLPVLTYGLEVLVFKDSDLDPLDATQDYLLQMILGLSSSVPKFVVNVLLGVLPIQAIAHKKVLGFFRNLVAQNGIEKEIICRDLAVFTLSDKHSWTSMVRRILAVYSLPSAYLLVDHPPTPDTWKSMVTSAINSYWENKISRVTATYPSLRFMDTKTFKIGTAHPAVTSITSNPFDTVRSRVRLKVLTGSYVLQSNRPAFNQSYSRLCALCKTGDETREHFLLTCPALQDDRMEKIREVDEILTDILNTPLMSLPADKQLAVIIDPSNFILQGDTKSRVSRPDLASLEAAIRALCFRLHSARKKLQTLVPRRNRKPKRRKPKESQTETSQAH